MRHRLFLAALPSTILVRLAADVVGSKRAADLTWRLRCGFEAALVDGAYRLSGAGIVAAGVLLGVAALGLAIAVELARKGA